MIHFTCPHYMNPLEVPEQYAGRTGACRLYGARITIPRAGTQSAAWDVVDVENLEVVPVR